MRRGYAARLRRDVMYIHMNKSRLRRYYIFALLTALIINEDMVEWALAIIVGEQSLLNGYRSAFKYFTISGYMFLTCFRLIPYVVLMVTVHALSKRQKNLVYPVFWGGLVGILSLIVWGTWEALRPLYTDEHMSSTTSLIFLFLPIYSIFTGVMGAGIGIFIYSLSSGNRHIKET